MVHHPLHNFSPEVGGGRLHGNGRLQGTLQYIQWLRKAFCPLELRVQFCLLVCCTYPSLSTVDKEKNRTDQRASLRADTRET